MNAKRALDASVFYVSGLASLAAVIAVVLFMPPELRTYAWLRLLLLVIAVISGLVFVVAGLRRSSDEVAREAHKFAAFWGSIFGFALGFAGLGIVAVILVRHHLVARTATVFMSGHVDAGQIIWMLAGALIVFSAWVIGYFIAWAAWWLRR